MISCAADVLGASFDFVSIAIVTDGTIVAVPSSGVDAFCDKEGCQDTTGLLFESARAAERATGVRLGWP